MSYFDPTPFLQIQDIALWSASFDRHLEYQPALHQGKVKTLSRSGTKADLLEGIDLNGQEIKHLRVIVAQGLRAVLSDPEANPTDSAEVLFQIEAEFAVTYEVLKMPPEEELNNFIQFNCPHNVWPFWRQHVYDTLKRASLPLITIPFFSGRKPPSPERATLKPPHSANTRD